MIGDIAYQQSPVAIEPDAVRLAQLRLRTGTSVARKSGLAHSRHRRNQSRFHRDLAHDVLPTGRWFNSSVVRRLLAEHESGRCDHGHRLWCLLMLELWVREHVEAPLLIAA